MADDAICGVCLNGDSVEGDAIVFCDGPNCNVAVHQGCYGISEVPDKEWLCSTCRAGLTNADVQCVLCPNRGGAMKPVGYSAPDGTIVRTGGWCHSLCASWIPETHFEPEATMEYVFGVADVNADRMRLRCAYCNGKGNGACVQCYVSTCCTAYHPSCIPKAKDVLMTALPRKSAPDEVMLAAVCPKHVELVKQKYLSKGVAEVIGGNAAAESLMFAPGGTTAPAPAGTRARSTPPRVITKTSRKNATVDAVVKKKAKDTMKSKPLKKSKTVVVESSEEEDVEPGPEGDTSAPEPAGTDVGARLWPKVEWFFTAQPSEEAFELLQPSQVPQWSEEAPVVSPRASPVEVVPVPAVARVASPELVETASNPNRCVEMDGDSTCEVPLTEPSTGAVNAPNPYELELAALKERLKAAVARNNTMKADLLETFRRDKIVRDRNWERVLEASWRQCEVWKSVSAFLIRGFRDQQADFNKRKQEAVPASWLIPTDGRQADAPAEDYEDEDAVCQVCFEGESLEFNPIVFCDRCNIAVHKRCYGITVIPEGDYFCDKCMYLKYSSASTVVSCCLCPLSDGAFKRTTDARWVHLVCAFWHKKAVITNLVEMGPVDVSGVLTCDAGSYEESGAVTTLADLRSLLSVDSSAYCVDCSDTTAHRPFPADDPPPQGCDQSLVVSSSSHSAETCQECRSNLGRTVTCAHPGCSARFHPLCAWYAGYYMTAHLAPHCDLVYSPNSDSRGLSFALHCQLHVPADVIAAGRSTVAQRQLRLRYRTSEDDSRANQRRKNKRKDPALQHLSLRLRVRSLPSDLYTDGVCGVCFDSQRAALSDDTLVCNICSVTVHRLCYGLGKDVKKDEFTCQRCQYFETFANNRGRSSDSPDLPVVSCALCPRPGGVFKRTLKGQWVHLYCALNIEEVIFTEIMGGIDLSRIPQQRRNLRCALCHEKNKGACMQCAGACYKAFHPMCAHNANWFMTFIEVDGHSTRGVGFCPAHTPADVKFNATTQTWERIDVRARLPPSFKRMVSMRKELEQARYLCERLLRREKFKRNLLLADAEIFDAERAMEQDPVIAWDRMQRAQEVEKEQQRQQAERNVVQFKMSDVPGADSLKCLRPPKQHRPRQSKPSPKFVTTVPDTPPPVPAPVAVSIPAPVSNVPRRAITLQLPRKDEGLAVTDSKGKDGKGIPPKGSKRPLPTTADAAAAPLEPAVHSTSSDSVGTKAKFGKTARLSKVAEATTAEAKPSATHASSPVSTPRSCVGQAAAQTVAPPGRHASLFPPWPSNVPCPREFDLVAGSLDKHSVSTLKALKADRNRYADPSLPKYSLGQRAASSRTWCSAADVVEAPIPRLSLLSTPERVSLDLELLRCYDFIVEGDSGGRELDFLYDLPDELSDDGPLYYDTINLPMSLHMIRDRVLKQTYGSVMDMLADVRTILNNVRKLGLGPDSDVYLDYKTLQCRYDAAMGKAHVPRVRGRHSVEPAAVAPSSPKGGSRRSSPAVVGSRRCDVCSGPCDLPGPCFEGSNPHLCLACLHKPDVVVGKRLWVFWTEDKKWYPGFVEACEPHHRQFRVLYDDGDWDFVDLTELSVSFGSECPHRIPSVKNKLA